MTCAAAEHRLMDYDRLTAQERESVDMHLAGCAACRAFLAVDALLAQQYSGVRAPADFRAAVLRRARVEKPLRKPSFVPEILDFVGWAAVLAFAGVLLLPLVNTL